MYRTLLLTLVVIGMMASSVLSDSPKMISYQGLLTDSSGSPLDTTVSIVFTIYDALSAGNIKWTETHPGVIVFEGLFDVILGGVVSIEDSVFNQPDRYLAVKVGAYPEMSPRTQLVSVGYSHRVNTVDGASGGNITGQVAIGPGVTNSGLNAFAVGQDNSASGNNSTVGGGSDDTASGSTSVVGGGSRNNASGNSATVGGGFNNKASSDASTIAGGAHNQASVLGATVGGGASNWADGNYATVSGGNNSIARGEYSTVSGGDFNTAGRAATIGGGQNNRADGIFSVVAGGGRGGAGVSNSASGAYSAVGGGRSNTAGDTAAIVVGGHNNSARGIYSVVAGGGGATPADSNSASGDYSAIGGGRGNTSSGANSTVAGGYYNSASGVIDAFFLASSTVSGGYLNTASASGSTVGGGTVNTSSGVYATVPGGFFNHARGNYSFAAGVSAMANHNGAIVIAANSAAVTSDSVSSGGIEQIVLRADGGLYITNTAELAPYDAAKIITTRGGAYLSGNGTTWTNASDKNQKEHFTNIDSEELLEKLSALPISRWNYKGEDETVTHIGPMAQDFYALFGVGSDDVSISTIDPAGIALAAIKALNKENQELKKRLRKLEEKFELLTD